MVPSSWFLLFVAGFFWTCPLGATDVDLEKQEKAEAHNAEGVKLAGERRYREASTSSQKCTSHFSISIKSQILVK